MGDQQGLLKWEAGSDDDEEEVIWEVPLTPQLPKNARRRRLIITVCLSFAFFGLGLVLAMLGPTLLDLGHQIGASVEGMAYAFTARSTGYFLGTIAGGYLFDNFVHHRLFIMANSMVLVAGGAMLVPLTQSIIQLGLLTSMQGIAMGLLDSAGNVLLLSMWGQECGPPMQTLHFSFGLGAFTSPLLVKPFLKSAEVHVEGCNTSSTEMPMTTTTFMTTTSPELPDSQIKYAYWIAGIIIIPVALAFFVLSKTAPKGGEKQARPPPTVDDEHRRQGTFRNVVIALSFLFLLVYVGLEVSYGGYIYTVAVKSCALQFSSSNAAILTSVYWGSFAFGRFVAIPISMYFSPSTMAIADLAGCIVASVLLFFLQDNATFVWIGSAVFGVSMASIFPTVVHMIEDYIDVTGMTASLIVIGAALGEMCFPLIVGSLIDSSYGTGGLMLVNMIGCVGAGVLFLVNWWWMERGARMRAHVANRKSLRSEDIGSEVVTGNVLGSNSKSRGTKRYEEIPLTPMGK